MYKIYGDIYSGNCYKVKLLMSLLDIEHEWIHIDILAGESQTNEFRSKNPAGKIPTLEFTEGGGSGRVEISTMNGGVDICRK